MFATLQNAKYKNINKQNNSTIDNIGVTQLHLHSCYALLKMIEYGT